MNNNILNSIRFVVFLLLQILIFNNINLFGYLNPYPYVLFILLYPVNSNKSVLLLSSFTMGILLDMFCNSGGIHTMASLVLAYIRPSLFKFAFGLSYEYQTVKIQTSPLKKQLIFIGFSVLIHHFVLFCLEAFSFQLLGYALLKVLFSGIFTFIFSVLIINLFKPSKK